MLPFVSSFNFSSPIIPSFLLYTFDHAFISSIILFLSLFVYSLSGVFLAPYWTVKHNKLFLTGPSESLWNHSVCVCVRWGQKVTFIFIRLISMQQTERAQCVLLLNLTMCQERETLQTVSQLTTQSARELMWGLWGSVQVWLAHLTTVVKIELVKETETPEPS